MVDFQAVDLLQADVTIDQPRLHRGPAPGAWQDRQVLGRRCHPGIARKSNGLRLLSNRVPCTSSFIQTCDLVIVASG